MNMQGHMESLAQKHSKLDQQLMAEKNRPMPDQETMARLKKEKLRLKEEMSRAEVH